ncbi:MAG: invasion associated locus B family protein [Rhizomicrobium sp.]
MIRHSLLAVAALAGICTQVCGAPLAGSAQSDPMISETRVLGSWTVRCYRTQGSLCDVSQAAFERQQRQRVLGVSIAFVADKNLYTGRIVVPLLVSFAKGMTIEIGSYRLANLKYHRCERDGCYVEGVFPQPMIDAMSQSGLTKGTIEIAAVNGKKVTLPISLDGFGDSLLQMKQWESEKSAPAAAKP